MRVWGAAIAAVGCFTHVSEAAAQGLPKAAQEYYKAGEQFAHCTAYFEVLGEVSAAFDLSANAQAAQDKARGWRLAGMHLLAWGLGGPPLKETERTYTHLVDAQITHFKADLEPDVISGLERASTKFDQACKPLAPLQENIIEAMRRAAASN